MKPTSRTATGVLFGAGAGALWGLVFLGPALLQDTHPLLMTIGRYLCYGLASALLLWPRWRKVRAALQAREGWALLQLALVGNVLYYLALSAAVQAGGIALTSLIIGFLPVAVTVIGSRDAGAVPLSRLRWPLAWCAAGALCIGAQAMGPSPGPASGQLVRSTGWGVVLAVCALVAWTWFAVRNSRHLQRLPAISTHEWNLLTGVMTGALALLLIPVAVLALDAGWADVTPRLAAVSVGVALAASIVGNALWNTMSRLLPLTMVGQMILFETLFALLYGLIWEARWPSPLEAAAFACVSLGVWTCVAAHRAPPGEPGAIGPL